MTDREEFYNKFGVAYHYSDKETEYPRWQRKVTPNMIWSYFQSKIYEAYKKGVADEIECVETSGEHLDLQNKLKSKQQEKIERVKELLCLAHPPFAGDLVNISDVLKIMEEK